MKMKRAALVRDMNNDFSRRKQGLGIAYAYFISHRTCVFHFSLENLLSAHAFSQTFESPRSYYSKTQRSQDALKERKAEEDHG